MKHKTILLSLFCILFTTSLSNCQKNIVCQEGINLLPMYGRVTKCPQQLEIDKMYLNESDRNEPDRSKAAIQTIDNGWYYLHQGDYDNAMKRVNQAWLLDSTNIIVYSSFSVILDLSNKTDDAIEMLDYTLNKIKERKDPEHPNNSSINTISNHSLAEFVVKNVPFAYKKTGNIRMSQHLHNQLNSITITGVDNKKLKEILELQIPELLN